jgi:hypothetical protein
MPGKAFILLELFFARDEGKVSIYGGTVPENGK